MRLFPYEIARRAEDIAIVMLKIINAVVAVVALIKVSVANNK